MTWSSFHAPSWLPRNRADQVGVCATLVLLVLVTINNLVTVFNNWPTTAAAATAPERAGGDVSSSNASSAQIGAALWLTLGLYILLGALVNMYRAMSTDTTLRALCELPTVLLADWRYCSFCEQNAPPRSHHCHACGACVLKRHSHCLFLGTCAGHRTLRFYVCFVAFVWLGCAYNTVNNAAFFGDALGSLSLRSLLTTFVPWLAWLLGLVSLTQLFVVFTNTLCLVLCALLGVYLLLNLRLVLAGQTWHENAHGICAYRLGRLTNLTEALGLNWLSAVLNPFAPLRLASDGASFRRSLVHADIAVNSASYIGTRDATSAHIQIPKRRFI